MKSVLILGCAGFIGSHLAFQYLDQGWEVWGIDNFISSKEDSTHFTKLRQSKNFHFIRGDIAYPSVFNAIKNCDLVLNFACPASPKFYQKYSVQTIMTSVVGTKNCLDFTTAKKIPMIHSSTSEIYGEPLFSPQKESDYGNVNPYGPRSCYDESKRCAESLCYEYLHKFQTDIRVIRIFNTYGPNMDPNDGRVISNFISQALQNKDITIYGNGSQTRSFCYISDFCQGITNLANISPNSVKTPINLGNPHEFTIRELAELVLNKIPSSQSKIVYLPSLQDDPTQRRPDISFAKSLLNWEPCVSLNQGLDHTIKYLKTQLNLP